MNFTSFVDVNESFCQGIVPLQCFFSYSFQLLNSRFVCTFVYFPINIFNELNQLVLFSLFFIFSYAKCVSSFSMLDVTFIVIRYIFSYCVENFFLTTFLKIKQQRLIQIIFVLLLNCFSPCFFLSPVFYLEDVLVHHFAFLRVFVFILKVSILHSGTYSAAFRLFSRAFDNFLRGFSL